MIYLFYLFAPLLVYLSYRSFRGGIEYLRYFRTELAKPSPAWTPMVTIIAPCKGVDHGMLTNFDALLQQDHPEYEVIFVVDDENDPAAGVIESAWREVERHVKLVVAQKAEHSSQKVENLREGVLHADDRAGVFVFVDSDARPTPVWLRYLIAPLEDDSIGAATGYRWFVSDTPTIAGELRSAWNASIASALGPNEKSNFAWGGSMAIRRETFDQLRIRERWQGTLSDDFTVTRAMNEARLRIRFVPQALTASVGSCTVRELLEFTTRQIKITRVYMPHLWVQSFLGAGLFCGVMAGSFLIVILSQSITFAVWFAIATLAAVSFLSVGKSWLRLRAVQMVLTDYSDALKGQRVTQLTLWLPATALFLFNCVSALFSRTVRWRGNKYKMHSERHTELITDRSNNG
jgi:cellulose synthase/poly-beta-1,6-N-acetylglucosamine synthase-like glycosyltransferase